MKKMDSEAAKNPGKGQIFPTAQIKPLFSHIL
jgi:hypothetical protein